MTRVPRGGSGGASVSLLFPASRSLRHPQLEVSCPAQGRKSAPPTWWAAGFASPPDACDGIAGGGAQGGQPQDPGNLPLSGFTYPLLQCPFDHGRWQSQVPGMSPWTSLGGSFLPAASPFCASVRVLVHFSDRRRTCALFPHLSGQRPAREQPSLCPSSHPPAWLPSFLSTRSHPSRPSVHSHARLPSVCP